MENTIPLKISYKLPLNDTLSDLNVKWSEVCFYTNKDNLKEHEGACIEEDGSLFSCSAKFENVLFDNDVQSGVYWLEDENESKPIVQLNKAQRIDFSGHIIFWANINSLYGSNIGVIFKAMFVDGQLINILLVDSDIAPVQRKKSKHYLQKKLLLFLAKTVHNVSLYLLQLINSRLDTISSK